MNTFSLAEGKIYVTLSYIRKRVVGKKDELAGWDKKSVVGEKDELVGRDKKSMLGRWRLCETGNFF